MIKFARSQIHGWGLFALVREIKNIFKEKFNLCHLSGDNFTG
jgi:hypothetical protein